MKKQFKVFKAAVKNLDEATHTATVIVSTATIDRDQEVVLPSAFKDRLPTYLAHPIMLASHNPYELTNQIGEAKKVDITKDGLEVTFEWYAGKGNPQADWAWLLATKGIAAFSVGMMVYGYKQGELNPQGGGYIDGIRGTFTDVELLEISQVLVPSNRDAVMSRLGKAKNEEAELLEMASKSIKEDEWRTEEKSAAEKMQEIIDKLRSDLDNAIKEGQAIRKELDALKSARSVKANPMGEGPQALPTPTKEEFSALVTDILKEQHLI